MRRATVARRRRGRPSKLVDVGIILLVVAGVSCERSERALPPGPATVQVTMSDNRFGYRPPRATGRVVFEARNEGRVDHELVLVIVPEDLPPLDAQLRSGSRRVIATLAGVPRRQPGRRGAFAVDLEPGRYGIICFIEDADGVQHAQKGMSSEFRVR